MQYQIGWSETQTNLLKLVLQGNAKLQGHNNKNASSPFQKRNPKVASTNNYQWFLYKHDIICRVLRNIYTKISIEILFQWNQKTINNMQKYKVPAWLCYSLENIVVTLSEYASHDYTLVVGLIWLPSSI